MFRSVAEYWGGELDVLVHSVGHARAEESTGSYLAITRDGYAFAHSLSAYSLVAASRAAAPLLAAGDAARSAGGASIITITYAAGEHVVPDYNVMASAKAVLETHVRYLAAELGPRNVRVNAISAGPIRTLSASAVKSLTAARRRVEERTPLRRNVDLDQVGDVALFRASDLSRCLTGEILHADMRVEQPVAFQLVAACSFRIARLGADPRFVSPGSGGELELRRRDEPNRLAGAEEEWCHKFRKEPRPLGEDVWLPREHKEIFDRESEPLGPDPDDLLRHRCWRG